MAAAAGNGTLANIVPSSSMEDSRRAQMHYLLMHYKPGQITHWRNNNIKDCNKLKFRLRNFPVIPNEDAKSSVLRFINAILKTTLNPDCIASCKRVMGWYRHDDVVVTFSTLEKRNWVFKRMPTVSYVKFFGRRVEISDELAPEGVRVLKEAVRKFGKFQVTILDGIVHIRMDEKNVLGMPTLIQYRKFLRYLKYCRLEAIKEEEEHFEEN